MRTRPSHFLFFFILLACPFRYLGAQQLTLSDRTTRKPLDNVSIFSPGRPHSVLSDVHGRADLSKFAENDSLIFYRLGYEKRSLKKSELRALGYRIELAATAVPLEPMVVSASKWEQNSRDIPQRIEHLDAEGIAMAQPGSAADLLGESASVFVQKSQLGGGSPMIRGFAANRVLIVVDGVRMNNAIFRSGNVQNVISLPPAAIEEAEVILGPGSVLYGSDALGGVMDFHTIEAEMPPDSSLLFRARAGMGMNTAERKRNFYLDYSLGKGRFSSRSFFSAVRFGHLRMGRYGPSEYISRLYCPDCPDSIPALRNSLEQRPSAYDARNFIQKLAWQATEDLRIDYAYHYSATSDIPRFDRYQEYRDSLPVYARWDYGPQRWQMQQMKIRSSRKTRLRDEIRLIAARQDFEESRITRRWNEAETLKRREHVRVLSLNLDARKNPGEKTEVYYGFEAVDNRVGSQGEAVLFDSSYAIPPRYPDRSLMQSAAAYMTAKYHYGGKWTFLGGLRYSALRLYAPFDTSFYALPFSEARLAFAALNGSAGAVWRPTDDWQFNIHFASAFRAPNIDDLAKVFDSEPGRVIVPNPGLRPEYAYNAELGAERSIASKLRLAATAYYTLLRQVMVRKDFQLNGRDSIIYDGVPSRVQALQNGGPGRIYGLELKAEASLLRGLNWTGSYNWQRGYEIDPITGVKTYLRHAVPAFGSSRLSYRYRHLKGEIFTRFSAAVPAERLPVSERAKAHIYARDLQGRPWSPAWWTLNLRTSWYPDAQTRIGFSIENILNRRYRPYSSGIAAPGRILKIDFELQM